MRSGRRENDIVGDSPCPNLAKRLRALRKQCRVTYRDMAEPACYSKSQLSKAAKGDRRPSWDLTKAYVTACFTLGIGRSPTPQELDDWKRTWDDDGYKGTEGKS